MDDKPSRFSPSVVFTVELAGIVGWTSVMFLEFLGEGGSSERTACVL